MANQEELSEEHITELKDAFDGFDADGNGNISVQELGSALESMGIKLPGYKIRDLIASVDTNADGRINFEEFQGIYKDEKLKCDVGVLFKSHVSKCRHDVNTIGGTSYASVAGTTHTVKQSETTAFADWINRNLADDPDCKALLPVNGENKELFEKCQNGIVLCKLINKSVSSTIDERTINKTNLNLYRKHENLTLAINSAQAIGCQTINIGNDDLSQGTPHLVLGLLWQIIRIGLLSDINLTHHPGLIHLLQEGETLEDLQKLSPEAILLRWVNHHLTNAGCDKTISNFSEDIKDSEAYTYLLKQIAPVDSNVDLSPLGRSDLDSRAEMMLQQAEKISCRSFVGPQDVVEGNAKLNLAFVANLFNNYPALDQVDSEVLLDIVEETREEKTYRNWMNSLGASPYVHHVYVDLKDGLVLFQIFDKVNPGCVNWDKVNLKFKQFQAKMKKIENCNYVIELGHSNNFSLVGIGGEDIHNGSTLILALLWQLMRAYTLKLLGTLDTSGKMVGEKDIIEWGNTRLEGSAKFESFKDFNLSDGIILIKLIEKLKPSVVDWNLVIMDATSPENKLTNARYAIGLARKIGAKVYALPEDIVEVKPKMILTIFACLMVRDRQK